MNTKQLIQNNDYDFLNVKNQFYWKTYEHFSEVLSVSTFNVDTVNINQINCAIKNWAIWVVVWDLIL